MIAELPSNLLILLAVITLLGAVMGFCVASILTKRKARIAIESLLSERAQGHHLAAEPDLQAARGELARLGAQSDSVVPGISEARARRERALEAHSRQQAERIQGLETELTLLEEKQLHLRREFASYKSNKRRELELAKNSNGQRDVIPPLPTLSRKIDSGFGLLRTSSSFYEPGRGDSGSFVDQDDVLGHPLSGEIEIPALAESELPDSVDELDLDVSSKPGSGARGRG
ncbi:MAG: hypothetical protein AB8B97_02590 [Granulosicoccus sp.]